jgi:hypothetical protein
LVFNVKRAGPIRTSDDSDGCPVSGRLQATPGAAYNAACEFIVRYRTHRPQSDTSVQIGEKMARKYSKAAGRKVAKVMKERKQGTLKIGRSGKTVKSRKQAVAIGLSEARKAGEKVPKKKSPKK